MMASKRPSDSSKPFEGFCVEVLEAAARHLKVELVWSFVHDNVTGRNDDKLGWNGVIKMLIDKVSAHRKTKHLKKTNGV